MKTLKIVGIVLAMLLLVYLVGGLVMPKGYTVERSQSVQAPIELVFAQVNDLRNWEAWSPWQAMDETMKVTVSNQPSGAGASYTWTGEAAGEGRLTILESEAPSRLRTEIDFGEMGSANGYWRFESSGPTTWVIWGFTGRNSGISGGWLTLMMDGMVGPQFEAGLARLKEVAEATPVPVEAPDSVPAPEAGLP